MNNTSTDKNVAERINYTSTGATLHLNSGDFSITKEEVELLESGSIPPGLIGKITPGALK